MRLLSNVIRMGAPLVLVFGVLGATRAPAPPPALLRIVATEAGFEFPRRVPAGLTDIRLVNHGRTPHEGNLVHFIAPGSAAAYADSYRAGVDFPANAEDIGGPGTAIAGDSTHVWLDLAPGHYAVMCFYADHIERGAARDLEAVGPPRAAAPPHADLNVRLVNFGYLVTGALHAGRQIVHVQNAGPEPHEFDLYRLAEGKTPKDFFAWKENHRKGVSPALPTGASGSMVTGREVWLPLTLAPGRYFAFCEVPARADGKPHYMHGMVREFTVPPTTAPR